VHIAEPLIAIADHVSATMELETALRAFRRLGAKPDAARASSILDELTSTWRAETGASSVATSG
jgi:hypothetical protein